MPPPTTRYKTPAPPRESDPFDGILPVDKPSGPTSHDLVAAVRRRFGIRKVGHGGTLDPLATGLLILLLGRGTKFSSRFMGTDKTYTGTLRLGITTNTLDADGDVVAEQPVEGVTAERLQDEMAARRGDSFQTPPMVSAVKVDGVPLYKHARQGRVIEREPRLIHVYDFRLTGFDPPHADFTLTCTKGTYVRTLCADIGDALGCGAHLTALRRTRSGELTVEQAIAFDTLMALAPDALRNHVIPLGQFA